MQTVKTVADSLWTSASAAHSVSITYIRYILLTVPPCCIRPPHCRCNSHFPPPAGEGRTQAAAAAAPAPMETSDSELDALAAGVATEEEPSTPKAATKGAVVKAEPFSPVDLTSTPIAEDSNLETLRTAAKDKFKPLMDKHANDPAMRAAAAGLLVAVLAQVMGVEMGARTEAARSKAISDTKSLEKGQAVDFNLCGILSSPAKDVPAMLSSMSAIAEEAAAATSPADLKKLAVDHGLSKKAANSKSFYMKLNAASQRYE